MKTIRKEKHPGAKFIAILAVLIVIGLVIAICIGYGKLKDLYLQQCIIKDMDEQVLITTGKMVKPDVIAAEFGLRPGANLALIDFNTRRDEVLSKIHTLRTISITRRLPDKVIIVAEERTPVAKLMVRGDRTFLGRVTDAEGAVFICQRGTQLLPTIRERQATPPGQRIKARTLAALTLILASQELGFSDLNVQDVDTLKPDFLLATLGDYSKAKISWEGMDEPPRRQSQTDLHNRLDHLVEAIRSKVGTGTKIWNATIPNRIFADTQERQ